MERARKELTDFAESPRKNIVAQEADLLYNAIRNRTTHFGNTKGEILWENQ